MAAENPAAGRLRHTLGYAAFGLASFIVCLFLTFDFNHLAPRLAQDLGQVLRAQVKIGSLDGYRLTGLRVRDLEIAAPDPADPTRTTAPFKVDELKVRFRLLPLLLGRLSASFRARLSGGGLEGTFSQAKNRATAVDLDLTGVVLDGLNLDPWMGPKTIKLGGKLDGKISLRSENPADPALWQGAVNLKLGPGKIYPFTAQGIQVEEVNYKSGALDLKLDGGAAELKLFELAGDDLPVQLHGTVRLASNFAESLLDLSGTINASPDYRTKMPLLSGVLPPDGKFTYKGQASSLLNFAQ